VLHIKIQNIGDSFDLYGGESFATLSDLVAHYTTPGLAEPLRDQNGHPVVLRQPLLSADPTSNRWFHGHLAGKAAEELLLTKSADGAFLVRESQSAPGSYVISARCGDRVAHIKVRTVGTRLDIGGGDSFETLSALGACMPSCGGGGGFVVFFVCLFFPHQPPTAVEHYRRTPMVEMTGNVVHLRTVRGYHCVWPVLVDRRPSSPSTPRRSASRALPTV
jgi:tyrosine-protein phosphatase non-receptor type 11